MNVAFEKLPEKYNGACQYDVLVEGVKLGTLYKVYQEGIRVSPGCIGGCRGNWAWELALDDKLEDDLDINRLWFDNEPGWRRQSEARREFERMFADDFNVPDGYLAAEMEKLRSWITAQSGVEGN